MDHFRTFHDARKRAKPLNWMELNWTGTLPQTQSRSPEPAILGKEREALDNPLPEARNPG
jgi:hypothetical protein